MCLYALMNIPDTVHRYIQTFLLTVFNQKLGVSFGRGMRGRAREQRVLYAHSLSFGKKISKSYVFTQIL